MNSLSRQRLTRALLLELQDGAFVISNVTDGAKPIFAARIREEVPRQQLWLQARRVRADGRLCWISSNPNEVRHLHLDDERQRQLTDIAANNDENAAEIALHSLFIEGGGVSDPESSLNPKLKPKAKP